MIIEERDRLTDGQEVAVATAHEILEWASDGRTYVLPGTEDVVCVQVTDLECLLEIVSKYHEAMDELDTVNPVIDGNEYGN